MKANELRLGNWVMATQTYSTEPFPIQIDAISVFDKMQDLQPIPLTPEILEKAGFQYSEYYQEYCLPLSCDLYFELKFVKDYYYPTLHKKPEFSSSDEQVIGLNRIQYLHELQNLIFILQGTELTINL